jgi:diguanylate cyclase (GGDEF)-like protein
VEVDGATIPRKHARAVLLTADRDEAALWVDAASDDLELRALPAATVHEAAALARRGDVDVVLLAAGVADGSFRDGLRALHHVREDLPVIVVGPLDHDMLREAFALGAADVVTPITLTRLGVAVSRALRDGETAASLRRLRSEAARIARIVQDEDDPVTGLPQRGAFEQRAKEVLERCERAEKSLAVLFLDVDHFRVVNDLGDHTAGDSVLRELAHRLREALPEAYVGRFGGDEFVLLCCEETAGEARAAADTAAAVFTEPFVVAGKPVHLTASVGIASAPEDAPDVGTLIATAEAAVFEAKRFGRNTIHWYRSPIATTSQERVLTRRDLHGAIERDELDLYYQPMYDLGTRAIVGVEALLRWRHPVHGIVLPDRFIPIAEQYGLIEEIGAWVLERALAQVRAWSDAGIPGVRVSVNVSARQLYGDALPALVRRLLATYDVAASSLEIEVTESSIMHDTAAALRLLQALRALGVRISIDDFGTGYTSLGFLKSFRADVLKIDRSFVADVADGAFDGAVVRAVTTLARGLGVRTVAEGVEAQAQLDRLRTLDCDVVQGFLLCRPLTEARCTPLLAAARA